MILGVEPERWMGRQVPPLASGWTPNFCEELEFAVILTLYNIKDCSDKFSVVYV